MSKQKQKFIDYCKGKIKDLEIVILNDTIYSVIMEADIRQFTDLRVIIKEDDEGDTLTAIDKDENIKINTPMTDPIYYATRMEFKTIDTDFYNNILEYWDDLDLDEEV